MVHNNAEVLGSWRQFRLLYCWSWLMMASHGHHQPALLPAGSGPPTESTHSVANDYPETYGQWWAILESLSRPALFEAATTFCAGLISISRATSHSNGSADGTLTGHPHGGPAVRKPTSGSHVCTTGFALHEAGQRCPYSAWRPVNPSSTIRQKCSPTNMPPHSSQPLFLLRSGADTMQKWTGPAETQRPRHWFG